jgi:hypothetical protein
MTTKEQPRAMSRFEYLAFLQREIGLNEEQLNKAHVYVHPCTCGQLYCYQWTLEHEPAITPEF